KKPLDNRPSSVSHCKAMAWVLANQLYHVSAFYTPSASAPINRRSLQQAVHPVHPVAVDAEVRRLDYDLLFAGQIQDLGRLEIAVPASLRMAMSFSMNARRCASRRALPNPFAHRRVWLSTM